MLNIYQIYEKFLTLFRVFQKKIETRKSKEDYAASLFLGLVKEDLDSIDIKCLFPDVTHLTIEEIMSISEKYAELLTYLNTENFNKHIYKILKDTKKHHVNNYKHIMLIDNIIHFWDVFYNLENKKQYQKYKKDQPLIRPSQAFVVK